jgi:prepilin-type processing-associated H-X9-DG protein
MRICPACAESISEDASQCPLCGVNLSEYAASAGEEGAVQSGKKMSKSTVTLIVVACIAGMAMCCVPASIALFLPAVQQAREAARRAQCQNNLRQIGLALMNYETVYGTFPPAFVADENGKPMHSWRVLILPYLEQQALYDSYDFSQPWDGPNNSRLLSQMPATFRCPSDPSGTNATTTAYVGAFGEHCIFRGSKPVRFSEIMDGSANTLMVGEATDAGIPWMKPDDIDVALHPTLSDPKGFTSHHARGVNFLLADGSVRFIVQSIDAKSLQAMFTRDGGETIGDY